MSFCYLFIVAKTSFASYRRIICSIDSCEHPSSLPVVVVSTAFALLSNGSSTLKKFKLKRLEMWTKRNARIGSQNQQSD